MIVFEQEEALIAAMEQLDEDKVMSLIHLLISNGYNNYQIETVLNAVPKRIQELIKTGE